MSKFDALDDMRRRLDALRRELDELARREVAPGGGFVALTGNQTVGGVKTFSDGISLGNETLSVYDEGSWLPAFYLGGAQVGMIAPQVGRYTRIGNTVQIWGTITLTTKGSSTGIATIGSLPFTSSNVAIPFVIPVWHYQVTHTGVLMLTLAANSTTMSLENDADGTITNVIDTAFADGDVIFFAGTYRTGA